jgi:futalosine hydrolase
MQLLLCAATPFEIQPVIDFIRENNISNVEPLVTGVGLTAATYRIMKAVHENKPDYIIQAGVAGCLDENLPLARVVIVEHESIGDLGVNENGKFNTLFDMGLADPNSHPWKNGRLSNNVEELKLAGLPVVSSVTVNEITTDPERIEYYRTGLHAQIESLEGASLHYVGLMEDIPFLQIRSISNFIGERDKKKWALAPAIASLNKELLRILPKLNNQ